MPGLEQRIQTYLQHLPDIIRLARDEFPIRGEQFAQRCFSADGDELSGVSAYGTKLAI